MTDFEISRRKALALGLGLSALSLVEWLRRNPTLLSLTPTCDEKNSVFKIGVASNLPMDLRQSINKEYLYPVASLLGRRLVVEEVDGLTLKMPEHWQVDALITSPNLDPRLPNSHALLGSPPFGIPRNHKVEWLSSVEGLELYQRSFAPYGLVALPLGVGVDEVGLLSRKPSSDIADLRGCSISSSDLRAKWFAALGMRPLDIGLHEQHEALQSAKLDFSEPLPPSLASTAVQGFRDPSEWVYHLGPGIKTAANVGIFWRKPIWDSIDAKFAQGLSSIQAMAFGNIADFWKQRELRHLQAFEGRANVRNLADDTMYFIRQQGLQLLERLKVQTPISAQISNSQARLLI